MTTFLICGLLRTIDHKRAVDAFVSSNNELTPNHIYLATPEGKSFKQAHVRSQGDQREGRARLDDDDALMQARLARYKTNTIPMLKELEREGRLHIIRADKPVDEIHSELKSLLAVDGHLLESPRTVLSTMRR